MNISQLRKLNLQNGGNFFARATMKHFGDTLANFIVVKETDTAITIRRKRPNPRDAGIFGDPGAKRTWTFLKSTGRLIPPDA